MKKLLGLLLTTPVALAACGGGSNYDVTVSAYGAEYLEKGDDWHKKLEEETGLKINVVVHSSNEELEQTLATTKLDIIMPSEYMAHKLADNGKLRKINHQEDLGVSRDAYKAEMDNSSWNALDGLKTNNVTLNDYTMGYTKGDVRFMVNTKNTTCVDAIKTAENITTLEDMVTTISATTFINKDVISKCNAAILDDDRYIAMIAKMALGETDIEKMNNPVVDQALEDKIKEMKDNGLTKKVDEDLSEQFSTVAPGDGRHDLVLSYNSDRSWIFEAEEDGGYGDANGLADTTKVFNIKNNSHLWIDTIAMTKDADANAVKVFKAMYETRITSSPRVAWYNSVFKDVEADLQKEAENDGTTNETPELIFDENNPTALFGYKLGSDAGYNEKITKAVADNWV